MSVKRVTVPRIRCERVDDTNGECPARLYGDDQHLSDGQVRALARERGWSTDPRDMCPSHR